MADDDTTGDVMSELAEALAAHRLVTPVQCRCGWRETDGHGEQWHEHAADVVFAALDLPARETAAEQRGRESVGLGDFLPDPCGDEERAPAHLDYAWLRCTRTRGHDGEHENRETGLTWAAEPAASPAPTGEVGRG